MTNATLLQDAVDCKGFLRVTRVFGRMTNHTEDCRANFSLRVPQIIGGRSATVWNPSRRSFAARRICSAAAFEAPEGAKLHC